MGKQLENIKGYATLARIKDHLVDVKNVCNFSILSQEMITLTIILIVSCLQTVCKSLLSQAIKTAFFIALVTMILKQLSNADLSCEGRAHLERIGVIRSLNAHVKEIATVL